MYPMKYSTSMADSPDARADPSILESGTEVTELNCFENTNNDKPIMPTTPTLQYDWIEIRLIYVVLT